MSISDRATKLHEGVMTFHEANHQLRAHAPDVVRLVASHERLRDALREANEWRDRLADKIAAIEAERDALAKELAEEKANRIGTWRCDGCGEGIEPGELMGTRWRWNDERFEHQCGHPQAGHVTATLFPWRPRDMSKMRGDYEQTIAHYRDRAERAESRLAARAKVVEATTAVVRHYNQFSVRDLYTAIGALGRALAELPADNGEKA